MREYIPPAAGENQPVDLTGARLALIPGTKIALVIPSPEAERRLSVQLGIPDRFKAIRADALHNLSVGAEAFAQCNYVVGGHLYLSVSLLTDHVHWRGGWLLFRCPSNEETVFARYLAAACDAIVVSLRKERSRGSNS